MRLHLRRLACRAALIAGLVTPAVHADALRFDFDDVSAPGAFHQIFPGFDNGPTLDYAGALFEGGVILSDVLFGNSATSGPNILATCDTCGLGDGPPPTMLPGEITVTLDAPADSVRLDVINGFGGGPGTFTLTARDGGGAVLATDSVVAGPMGSASFVQRLDVSADDIASFTVTTGLSTGYTFAIDTVVIGEWENLGNALAGTLGEPALLGEGAILRGETFDLTLTNALPGGSAFFVMGFSTINAPFKFGVLVPSVDILIGGLPIDGTGTLSFGIPWPPGIPAGTKTYYQHWIPDGAGPVGFAASNAVVGESS